MFTLRPTLRDTESLRKLARERHTSYVFTVHTHTHAHRRHSIHQVVTTSLLFNTLRSCFIIIYTSFVFLFDISLRIFLPLSSSFAAISFSSGWLAGKVYLSFVGGRERTPAREHRRRHRIAYTFFAASIWRTRYNFSFGWVEVEKKKIVSLQRMNGCQGRFRLCWQLLL